MRRIIALSLSLLLGCGPGLTHQLVLQSLADLGEGIVCVCTTQRQGRAL